MKKHTAILMTSLVLLSGCGGNGTSPLSVTPPKETTPPLVTTPEEPYDWTKDPKFAGVIVKSDPIFGSDESYDKARVKPDPSPSIPGSLGERIGYIENQWNIGFDKDMTPPEIYAKVTHKATFVEWLSTYIPYPIRVKDYRENSDLWGIEVDAPSDKIAGIDATLKGLVDQYVIWIAEHPGQVLPQWDTVETRSWVVRSTLYAAQESPAFGDMQTVTGSGSWHLPYIGMDQLVARGINLTATGIGIGIVDSGLSLGHEDLSSDVVYLDGGKSSKIEDILHGTAVVGASSGSIFGNGMGVRGVVQTKTVFADKQGTELNFPLIKQRIERVLKHPYKPRVVNISFSLGNDSYNEKLVRGKKAEFNEGKNFMAVKYYRDLFTLHPDVLFVVSAGNVGTPLPWDNAAVQYRYDPKTKQAEYSPLLNVLMVAANGPDNVLHANSDWGTGVDISAPSGYMTLRCFDGKNSYYNTYPDQNRSWFGTNQYTPKFLPETTTSEVTCNPGSSGQASFGTSFAAPLVSGAAILLFSADPLLTPKDVKNYLTRNDLVDNRLRYAGERWKSAPGGTPEKETMFKPLPILDVAASYDAVIAHKKAIEKLDVSTRSVQISVIDSNSIQDEYFNLVVNGNVIGKVENLQGATTSYPTTLKSGDNLVELRITNTVISDTMLTMKIDPDGIVKIFSGNDISYAWTVRAPWMSRWIVAS